MVNSKNKYKCEICGEPFRVKYNYIEHVKKHLKEELNKSFDIGANKLAGINGKRKNR